MQSDRPLERLLLIWTPVVMALHLLAPLLGDAGWGVHLYTFLPRLVGWVAAALLVGVLWLSWRPSAPLARAVGALPDPAAWTTRQRLAVTALFCIGAGALLWNARLGHTLLGDGNAVLLTLASDDSFHPRSPLTQWVLRTAYEIAAARADVAATSDVIAQDAVAATSVLAGMLFVPVAWAMAREVSRLLCTGRRFRRRDEIPVAVTWLVLLMLLTQGYIQLFFGYVEHYTLYLLAVGTYLWLGLRCARRATSFLWPCLSALVAFAFHFSGAVLFPSLLVLAGLGLRDPNSRRTTLGTLAIVAVLVAMLPIVFPRVSKEFEPLSAFASVFKEAVVRGGSNAVYMWSWQHIRDFVNIQLLAGPLGLAVFLPGMVVGVRAGAHRTQAGAFLALVGLSLLGAAWIASEPFLVLGYAREWDMLVPASLGFTVAGLGLFFTAREDVPSLTAPLIWAVALSLFHTVPWIAVNADGRRGVERMKTLPLGEGRAATTVGTWYMRHGTDAQAIEWFERALREYPRNVNAWDKLGLTYVGQNRMNEAARAYARAVEIRPDKIEYRRNLVESLRLSGQFEESLPHNEWLCERQPENLDYWLRLTSALEQTGRADEVPAALARAYAALAEAQQQAPDDYFANFNLGAVELALDRPAEALLHFQNASRAQPQSDLALLNMGVAALRLGRPDEARHYLEQVRSRTTDHGVRQRATELLQTASPSPQ